MDDRTLINRIQALQDAQGSSESYAGESGVMLCQVVDLGNIPTVLPGIFAVHPVRVSGPNGEGQTPTVAVSSSTVFVTVVGAVPPVAGDYLQARSDRGRWFAQVTRSRSCCQPCCTPDGDGENETVVWNMQSAIDDANARNGQTDYWWYTCFIPDRGEFFQSHCFNTTDPSGGGRFKDCLGQPFVVCGEIDFSISEMFSNPVTFYLASDDGTPAMHSQVVKLFTTTMDGSRWGNAHIACEPPFGEPCFPTNCGGTATSFTVTRYAQCFKTCTAGVGTTYSVNWVEFITSGRFPAPVPTDLRDLSRFSVSRDDGHSFEDPVTFQVLWDSFQVDQFTFPADGSFGVVSCRPLLLSASHAVTSRNCGLPDVVSTNSITVSS